MTEMAPDLLALLSPEQQAAWEMGQQSEGVTMIWDARQSLYAALLELAQTKYELKDCINSHKKVDAELEKIWTILDDAECATFCQSNMGPGEYGFAAYQEYLNNEPKKPDKRYDCDCWKSKLPK